MKTSEKIAIVGLGATFGVLDTLDAFERSIYSGTQPFIPFPAHRGSGSTDLPQALPLSQACADRYPPGAYLENLKTVRGDLIQSSSPAAELTPAQDLLLQVATTALQDAGIGPGKTAAVLIAAEDQPQVMMPRGRSDQEQSTAVDDIANLLAEHIAQQEGLTCPAFTLIPGSHAVFKALELAQRLLCSDQVDVALVGAVNLVRADHGVQLASTGSPSGTPTLSYDRNAASTLGEGAGAVVLQRLDGARVNQTRIYGIIDAIAFVQGTAVPQAEGVTQACRNALEQADIAPENVGYLEVTGSGVAAADAAEIQGVNAAYQANQNSRFCALGSIKANIGHTGTASDIASLIKTALCLYHQYLPVTPGWSGPQQPELWRDSPFYVPERSRLWLVPPNASHRTAAISGIEQGLERGIKTNLSYVHILLAEEPSVKPLRSSYLEQTPFCLFPLAAADAEDIERQLAALNTRVAEADSLAIAASETFSQFAGRAYLPYAVAILGHNPAEVEREIQRARTGIPKAFAQGKEWKTPLGSYFSPQPQGQRGGVAFVYPGAFTSYMGLIDSINRLFPRVMDSLAIFNASDRMRELMDAATQAVYPRTLAKLTARQKEKLELQLQDDATTMLLFGTGAAVFFTTILRDYFQIKPQASFGYSLGEFSMMYALQAWIQADTIAERLHESALFKTRLTGPKETVREFWGLPMATASDPSDVDDFWGTYVLFSPAAPVQAALTGEPRVYLTHINTPTEVVIAGDNPACLRVIQTLNCDYFPVPAKHVLHCEAMQSEFSELVDWFTLPVQPIPDVSLYTAATYSRSQIESNAVARSIAQALCQPLDFPRLIDQVYQDGARIFIELGPGGSCSRWIRETLKQTDHTTVTFNTRGVDDHTAMLRAIAKLVGHRVSLDLACLYAPLPTALPTATPDRNPASTLTPVQPRPGADISSPIVNPSQPTHPPIPVGAKSRDVNAHPVVIVPSGANTTTLNKPPATTAAKPRDRHLPANGRPNPHASFLAMRQASVRHMGQLIEHQMMAAQERLRDRVDDTGLKVPALTVPTLSVPSGTGPTGIEPLVAVPIEFMVPPHAKQSVVLDEAAILEFATGRLAAVFGPDYAEIDTYSKRLRLPMPPYLFVSRVTELTAQRGQFQPCRIETEYDIPLDAWYAVDNQVPAAIFLEAYQSIIILLSYLGVDFETQGKRSFRALDGTLTFLDTLPWAGTTFRCQVQINSFSRSGDTFLCFYDCHYFQGDRKFLTIQAGAGLFADHTLKKAAGIAISKPELAARKAIQKQSFTPLLACPKVAFQQQDIRRLSAGDLVACFGENYRASQQQNPALRLPQPAFQLLDRVLAVNPNGGAWGLGMVVAEKDLHPEHWYFNCHFKNDYCMPGAVIGEGAIQLLQFYLLYLGLQTRTQQAHFHPILHLGQTNRSRGQVVPMQGQLLYQLEVTAIGLEPTPFLKAEALVKLQDKTIASIKNLGIQLREQSA